MLSPTCILDVGVLKKLRRRRPVLNAGIERPRADGAESYDNDASTTTVRRAVCSRRDASHLLTGRTAALNASFGLLVGQSRHADSKCCRDRRVYEMQF